MSDFDAGFTGRGMELFEHWEASGNLLLVASTPQGMRLEPGDTIVRRRWAAAGEPEVYNRARLAPGGAR